MLLGLVRQAPASADAPTSSHAPAVPAAAPAPAAAEERSPFALHFEGYGDLQFAFHRFGPNQNRAGGSQRDARLVFDDARFVFAIEGEMPFDLEFESEIEFEHGGTAAAQAVEYEEFGEIEQEIEKGGEVLLEELFLRKTFAERYSVSLGRFYVAMGTLSRHYRPTDYLASTRSEAESSVIPTVWPELGAQLEARPLDWLRVTAQVVNGLDSTGFSSQHWIASGHQRSFELVRATDLAAVARIDFLPRREVELGLSAYYGGTSRNRPKPDLIKDCTDGSADFVAACGYVNAALLLLDAHAHFKWGPMRGNALALWGHLSNARAISTRNDRLSNALNVPRTPVSDEALALWAELGLDVAPWLGLAPVHVLEPYVRVDHYDTMFGTRAGLFDNPRFERTVVTAGVGYTLHHAVVLRADYAHRWFGSSALNSEDSVRLSAGFVY